ncbi:beta strand repeat-containing protein [Methylomicrobium lacus]|uniref:beta strand repeat-containing protein n=1 Tax=Methylomicrobium lacus TaxID=136992 RepID=UPI00045E61EA|nr:hypothetical protein [Methylomicrobium lacus]
MALYKDASGQLVIAASLPPDGSAVSGPASSNLVDVAPWLRALDSNNGTDWHPANYYVGTGEAVDAIDGYLTRQNVTLPADASGVVADFTEAAGSFVVHMAGIDITALCTFSSSAAVNITASINSAGAYSATALAANVGSITFTATYKNQSINLVFTVATASAGTNARAVQLSITDQAFAYNTAGSSPSPASATVMATAYNTSGTVYYEFLKNAVSVQNTTTNTYTYTPQASFANMPDMIEVAIREGASTGTVLATDTISALAIQAGADAITVVLSNAAHTIPTDSAGANGNYTGSGTTVRVFEGATELNYDGVGTAAGNWNVMDTGTSITPGTKTDSGAYATYDNHSAMTADTASISYAISGKCANGNIFSQTVLQTFSKSKTGSAGSNGLNAATVYLFQRTASATPPSLPSLTVTYTFATGAASNVNNGWSQSMPAAGGSYRWVTTATALSAGSTDTIANTEWASASLMSQDGATGATGATGAAGPAGSNGIDARSVILSMTTQAFTYDTAGNITLPTNTTVSATAYNASGTVYYEFLVDGVSQQNTTTNSYNYFAKTAFANMPDLIECKIREGSSTGVVVATDTISALAIKAGSDAISVVLSNDAHTIPTDSAGNGGNYSGSGTTVKVFEGAAALTYDGVGTSARAWNVTGTGTSITVGSKIDSGSYATYNDHSAMTADTASVSYAVSGRRADGTSFALTVLQTFSKSKTGATGATGPTGAAGSNGIDSRAVALSVGTQAFAYNSAGTTPSPASTTVTATAYNASGTVYYEFLKDGVSQQNTTTNTYSYTPQASYSNMPDKIDVKIREGSSTGVVVATDVISIIGIKPGSDGTNGTNGTNGTDGTDSIYVLLSNAAHTVPTDSTGNNGDYFGSGTIVRVYEGATELTYDGVGASTGTWNATGTGTSITVGSKTDGGSYLIFGAASAMTANTASISIAVSGKRANGTAFSQTVTQTLSKSKQGSTGATGATGPAGVNGSSGATGTPGDSSRTCYTKTTLTSLASTPTTITTSGSTSFPAINSWGTGTSWQGTPPAIAAGELLFQSDGVYSAATGNTVWNVPYLSSLKVGSLSAITTETGTLSIGAGGYLKSGQTAFDTGTGFWLGGGTTPKMSMGNSTEGFTWNGSTFTVRGDVIATGNINAGAVTAPESVTGSPHNPTAADTYTSIASLTPVSVSVAVTRIVTITVDINSADANPGYISIQLYKGATWVYEWTLSLTGILLNSADRTVFTMTRSVSYAAANTDTLTVKAGAFNGGGTHDWATDPAVEITAHMICSTGKR